MIEVKGQKIVLAGSESLLNKELSYLISSMRSRIASMGKGTEYVEMIVDGAIKDSKSKRMEDLRHEARMQYDQESIKGLRP